MYRVNVELNSNKHFKNLSKEVTLGSSQEKVENNYDTKGQ